MKITIDQGSGCCFGVVSAIGSAEALLEKQTPLYCLGDIVHNNRELERLSARGLVYINYDTFRQLRDTTVLIRAHGEPPETYKIALKNNISLIDASCPVVLKLQANIRRAYDASLKNGGQVVIFGKKGHAEVIGLLGQTFNNAIVVSDINDLEVIDYSKPVYLFAQTTQNAEAYREIGNLIKQRMQQECSTEIFTPEIHNTICRLVARRADDISAFAKQHDVILFVSDPKSSNGKYLFEICKNANQRSFFISDEHNITPEMLREANSVGICGATSTPRWLMQSIADKIQI